MKGCFIDGRTCANADEAQELVDAVCPVLIRRREIPGGYEIHLTAEEMARLEKAVIALNPQ